MAVSLEPAERDALHARILAAFTLFGDLDTAISEGNEEACYKLARKISDGLRLLLDGGLGWQQRTVGPTVLTIPDSELRQIVGRMKIEAMAVCEARRPEHEESRAEWEEIEMVRDACKTVLEQTYQ